MNIAPETTVLDAAIAALGVLPGLRVVESSHLGRADAGKVGGARPDGVLELETASGRQRYVVESKGRLSPSTLSAALESLQRLAKLTDGRPLLVTHHASERLIDLLLEEDVEFVDAAGNMYLNSPACYALVRGRSLDKAMPADAFTPTGLRVVYALLAFPRLREGTYRDICDAVEVGLGSVSRTVNGLLEQGYLVRGGAGTLHLVRYEDLLSRWELGYIETLRPRLRPSAWRLTSLDRGGVLERLGSREDVLLGGEAAATALTGYLKPQTLTLHVPEPLQRELRMELRLLPAQEEADLYLLSPFTPGDAYAPPHLETALPLAHPLLVRAELLALGGDRLRETATKLLQDVIMPELARA